MNRTSRVTRWLGWAGLLRRALRWRRPSAVMLVVVGVVAVGAAALGPMFLQSADDSTLFAAVEQAPAASTDLTILTSGGVDQYGRLVDAVGADAGATRWLGRPGYTAIAGVRLSGGGTLYGSTLLARTGICAHLRLVAGSCPGAPGEVALSARSSNAIGMSRGPLVVGGAGTSTTLDLRVVGVYAVPVTVGTGYWGGSTEFDFGSKPDGQPPQLDPLVTATATVLRATSLGAQPQLIAALPVRPGGFRSGGAGGFGHALAAYQSLLDHRYALTLSTSVGSVLAAATHAEGLMSTVVDSFIVELVVLCLLVLYQVVSVSSRARTLEAELARRRGFTRRALFVVAVGEPVALLLVAFPIGIAAAWVVVAAGSHRLFAPGTPIPVTGAAVLTGLAALAGGLVSTAVATWDLWHGATRQAAGVSRSRAVTAAADAFAVALAVTGLVALSARGALDGNRSDPVAAVAPALLALGAGVVGLRIAGLVVRGGVAATRDSRRVALFLAVRAVARGRPAALRRVLGLTAAVALAVFAVSAWSLASTNRATVAETQVGAARVLDVSLRPGVSLEQAVDQADPSGRQAMAAELYESANGRLLAVDASRLAAVAAWPAGLATEPVTSVARYLAPVTPAPITLTADGLRAVLDLSPGAEHVSLSATVFNESGQNTSTVDLGRLRPGTASYTASLGGFCATVCRLVNLIPVSSGTGRDPATTTITLDSLAMLRAGQATALPFGAARRGAWTAVPPPATASSGPEGRGVTFRVPTALLPGGGVVLTPADLPAAIPVVATPQVLADNPPSPPDNTFTIEGLDSNVINVAGQVEATALPEIGGDASLVALDFAQLAQNGPSNATPQVWLTASAGSALLQRLQRDGVTVASVTDSAGKAAAADKGPLALAYTIVVFSGPAAILLAVGAAAFAILAGARARRANLEALTVVGVRRVSAIRAVLIENGLVLGVAWILGGAVGYAASRLALGSLPQFPQGTGGIPISHQIQAAPFVLTLAGIAILLFLTAVVTTRIVLRSPRPDTTGPRP